MILLVGSKSKLCKKVLVVFVVVVWENNGLVLRWKWKECKWIGLENRRWGGKDWRKIVSGVVLDDNFGYDSDRYVLVLSNIS